MASPESRSSGFRRGSETLLHLYTSRGRWYELSGDYDQALANYAELSALPIDEAIPGSSWQR